MPEGDQINPPQPSGIKDVAQTEAWVTLSACHASTETAMLDKSDRELVVMAGASDPGQMLVAEIQRRLKAAIEDFSVQSTRQTTEVISLTKAIKGLTLAMLVMMALQIVIAVVK